MIIEVNQQDVKVGKEPLFEIIVDGKVEYKDVTYDELITITIGDIDTK